MSSDHKNFTSGLKILVFIIAYNEELNIATVIEDIRTNAPSVDIVLIDDCSTDKTVKIAKNLGVYTITHLVNSNTSGYAAVRTAMMYAYMNNYDICCQVDGDGQHDASYLFKIIEPIASGCADLVIGSRFLGHAGYTPSLARKTGIKVFSSITSFIIGQQIKDISSGFKASGRNVINLFANYPFLLTDTNEMLILIKKCGFRIVEMPVKMRDRVYGRSSHSFLNMTLYPIRTLIYILSVIIQPHRLP